MLTFPVCVCFRAATPAFAIFQAQRRKGVRLKLNTVRELAWRHGGMAHVVGRIGVGLAVAMAACCIRPAQIRSDFKGQTVLLVDDSIVRGTTSKELVIMVRWRNTQRAARNGRATCNGRHVRGTGYSTVPTGTRRYRRVLMVTRRY